MAAAFFERVLGPNHKYSSCFYRHEATTLREAEEEALRQTVEHAALADGMDILELGCGWGSLSLWMARQFPNARIIAVSNSHSQRQFVEAEAAARGLRNLIVVTEDMNVFAPNRRFDRIVSVEMFEHMMNWRALLARARSWLKVGTPGRIESWARIRLKRAFASPSGHRMRVGSAWSVPSITGMAASTP